MKSTPASKESGVLASRLFVFLALISAVIGNPQYDLQKKTFQGLGCSGVYDSAKFARLDRVCEECYQLYREPEVHSLCRSNCFKNEYIWRCVEALIQKNEKDRLTALVDELYGK